MWFERCVLYWQLHEIPELGILLTSDFAGAHLKTDAVRKRRCLSLHSMLNIVIKHLLVIRL